jgi:PHYB activation tagged suppressor 1
MGWLGSDFLGLLLSARHDTDKAKGISVEDVIDECKSFYAGGTFLLLAIYTDWQDKARKEVL